MKLPRKLYILFLILLPIAGGGLMGVSLTRWFAAELEAKDLETDLRTEQNRLEVLRSHRDREATGEDIPHLPDSPGVAEFLSQIEKAVQESGIHGDGVRLPKVQEPGQQVYEISGKGRTGQIARFLAILENDPRLPILDQVRVFSSEEGETCFELELLLFYKLQGRRR